MLGVTGIVLLIFPPPSVSWQSLAKAAKKSGAKRITFEGPCIVWEKESSRIVSNLANIVGRDNVVRARRVSARFSDLIDAIVDAGTEAIMPCQSFYVKAILTTKTHDYVERDVEFASAGMLVERLAEINALPARSQHAADRVIMAVVGKKWAYVCAR